MNFSVAKPELTCSFENRSTLRSAKGTVLMNTPSGSVRQTVALPSLSSIVSIMKKILLLAALLIGSVSAAWSADHKVRVSDFQFTPSTVNVVAGDTITWRWQNGMHTTTSVNIPAGARPWNAPIDSANTRFRTRLRQVGTYTYQCNFHVAQGMTGTIVVSAAAPGQVPATH